MGEQIVMEHDRINALHDRLDQAYCIIFGLRARLDTEPYVEDWQIKRRLDEALKTLITGIALAHHYSRQPVPGARTDERAS